MDESAGTVTALDHASIATEAEACLKQRLQAVTPILLGGPTVEEEVGTLLERLVVALQPDPEPARVWLLCTAALGAFPTADDVVEGIRRLQVDSTLDAFLWLLDRALEDDFRAAGTNRLEIITDRILVDVDHSARYNLHTGIQQVVRRVLPQWHHHPIEPVAWADRASGWRPLSDAERARVMDWGAAGELEVEDTSASTLLVPWQTVAVLLETPPTEACYRLAALAQYSGTSVVAVGYDCVPIVSADLVPPAEPVRFTRFLVALKYCSRIAAISSSALVEFQGFASALVAQGLPGPDVVECRLAEEPLVSDVAPIEPAVQAVPQVLCVGSLEPRKNHLGLLHACEQLWREGLTFELVLVGGSGWGQAVPNALADLQAQGRPVNVLRGVSRDQLATAYSQARFTVFPSLHEGYGLPIVESLEAGTPVITASYGSAAEIASTGGALLIDPRRDDELLAAMRSLLTDDTLLARLSAQARSRPGRSWSDYASELWELLVDPEGPGGGE